MTNMKFIVNQRDKMVKIPLLLQTEQAEIVLTKTDTLSKYPFAMLHFYS